MDWSLGMRFETILLVLNPQIHSALSLSWHFLGLLGATNFPYPCFPWIHELKLKQLLNGDSGGHLMSKILLEESLRASFNHGQQWELTGNDNSSSCLIWGGCKY